MMCADAFCIREADINLDLVNFLCYVERIRQVTRRSASMHYFNNPIVLWIDDKSLIRIAEKCLTF